MKILKTVLFIFIFCGSVLADDFFIIRQDRFVRIEPIFQNWSVSSNSHFSEFSAPFFVYVPVGYYLGLNVEGGTAQVNGNALQKLQGMTDTQIGLSYHLERYNTVINLGVNLPSGQNELTSGQFQTSRLISLYHFDLRTSNFGQGLNVSGGFTWAKPFGPRFVLGLGAAYQVLGKYKPVKSMLYQYNPGDETILTAGFDVKLNATSSFSFDFIYTSFGTDLIGDEKTFASGKKMIVNVKYDQYFGYDELRIFARYRSKDKNKIAIAGQLYPEEEKSLPDQSEVWGLYKRQFSPIFRLGGLIQLRHIAESTAYTRTNIYAAGLLPEYKLLPNLWGLGHLKYLLAQTAKGHDFFGLEVGVGLEYKF